MNPNSSSEPRPQPKVPKDGFGPRGYPDCYYTSRTLNSTFRYVRFVKKLRLMEEEIRRGIASAKKEMVDNQTLHFFARCDRRALINNVSNRVQLCLESYNESLEEKRKRLVELLTADEEMHIRAFVVQTQAGAEEAWQDKQKRLEYLLAKRRKERDDKFKDTPLSKCAHVLPCLIKLRAKEAEEFQLYQMREKQMRKMAEAEMDKMWYDVVMKESEALAARMEMDVMERLRRNTECKQHSDRDLEMRRQQRAKEQEQLKQESLYMKAKWHADDLKEAEEERKRQEKRDKLAQETKDIINERNEMVAKLEADAQLIRATWDSLAGQGLADEKAKEDLRRQKERDLDVCNMKMVQMKDRIATIKYNNEPLILAEGQRIRDEADLKRCLYRKKCKQDKKDNVAAILKQAEEKSLARDEQEREAANVEYRRNVDRQLDELVKHKELTDGQARKLYQKDLLDQIAYNDLIKKRARQEQIDQIKKCEIATREYADQIRNMVSRPYFSDQVHPFMKQMASGLKIVKKCKCSHPDYCADPSPPPAPSKKGE